MVVRLFQRPYDFQLQPLRARNIGGNSERLSELLGAVLDSGGLGGSNISDFTPDSRWESPGAILEELWTMGAPIWPNYNWPNANSYLFRPLTGIEAVIDNIVTWVNEAASQHPFVLFPLDALRHATNGMRTADMAVALNMNEDRSNTLLMDLCHLGLADNNLSLRKLKTITDSGRETLECFTGGMTFISEAEDLEEPRELRWMWCLLRDIAGYDLPGSYPLLRAPPPYIVNLDNVVENFNSNTAFFTRIGGRVESSEQLIHILQRLGIDFSLEGHRLTLNERLFLKTNVKEFLRAGLPDIDRRILRPRITSGQISVINSPIQEIRNARIVVVHDTAVNACTPEHAVQVNPLRFDQINFEQTEIIIMREPRSGLLKSYSGHLHAFVQSGGRLILHRMRQGRRGRTFNILNGLPPDFERLGVVDAGWRFDTTLLPDTPIEPIYTQEFRPQPDGNTPLIRFGARYGRGWFIFVSDEPSRELYSELFEEYPVEEGYHLETVGPHWNNRNIAELPYRSSNEADIYHPVGQTDEGGGLLHQRLEFEFSRTFSNEWLTGAVGGADLVAVLPDVLVIEVDSLGRGSDPSPDQSHQDRTFGYRVTAREALSGLASIIASAPANDVVTFSTDIVTQINQQPGSYRSMMLEVFERHLEAQIAEGLKIHSFEQRIRDLGADEPGPPTMLLGQAYGMVEDDRRTSAREHSELRGYSLWTYRDFYEFIVRTDDMEAEERREHLLALCMVAGPVYFALRDRLPVDG
ncbi:MAG: hypothetical protein CMM94_00200 [Rickettsiales bacterium]|nr:hypothetical protein [Rickettsiales bacterium]